MAYPGHRGHSSILQALFLSISRLTYERSVLLVRIHQVTHVRFPPTHSGSNERKRIVVVQKTTQINNWVKRP
jgi:hypothetical protein